MVYTVSEYLRMLKLAKRSDNTITTYRRILLSYARFLDVPLDEVHNHLLPENLIKYAASRADCSGRGTTTNLNILHRYFAINGVTFDVLESNIIKAQDTEEQDDKPLTRETLQRMMEIASIHAKAMITFWISTGCRRGECARILLSDVDGDTVRIRNEYAKGGHGGLVYLTAEAREYLDMWLEVRDEYIKRAGRYHLGKGSRPIDDKRLFACSHQTMRGTWSRLYAKVDGEKGKYHDKCTIHSCRKYFRTQAVRAMPLDLVEKLMRHTGYLTGSYVRITDEEARKQFHAGESALYITRADDRIQTGKLAEQERTIADLTERLNQVEAATAQVERERTAIRATSGEFVRADDVELIVKKAVKAAMAGKK